MCVFYKITCSATSPYCDAPVSRQSSGDPRAIRSSVSRSGLRTGQGCAALTSLDCLRLPPRSQGRGLRALQATGSHALAAFPLAQAGKRLH